MQFITDVIEKKSDLNRMSKRKYNVNLLNDDEEGATDEQLSGLNIFKKAKAAAANQVTDDKNIRTAVTQSEESSTAG